MPAAAISKAPMRAACCWCAASVRVMAAKAAGVRRWA